MAQKDVKLVKYMAIMLIMILSLSSFAQDDNNLIVFTVQQRDDPLAQLCTIDPINTDKYCHTDDQERHFWNIPSWSPDGQSISILVMNELLIMDSDGTNRRVAAEIQSEWSSEVPDWSPDGNSFVFHDIQNNDEFLSLYVYSIEEDTIQKLTVNDEWHNVSPNWSPNGNEIVFVSALLDDSGETVDSGVFIVDTDGSNLRRLTEDDNVYFYPKWSPDGQYIAFSGIASNPNDDDEFQQYSNMFIVNADGSDFRELTNLPIYNDQFEWSPDSLHIGFTVLDETSSEIYSVDVLSGDLQQLTNNEFPDAFETWSPNGDYIAYSSRPTNDLVGWRLFTMDASGDNPQYLADCGTRVRSCQADWRNVTEQD